MKSLKIAVLTALIATTAMPVQAGVMSGIKENLKTHWTVATRNIPPKAIGVGACVGFAGLMAYSTYMWHKTHNARIKAIPATIDALKPIIDRAGRFADISEAEIDKLAGLTRSEKAALKTAIKNYSATKFFASVHPEFAKRAANATALIEQLQTTINGLSQYGKSCGNSWLKTLPKMAWNRLMRNRVTRFMCAATVGATGYGLYKYFSKK